MKKALLIAMIFTWTLVAHAQDVPVALPPEVIELLNERSESRSSPGPAKFYVVCGENDGAGRPIHDPFSSSDTVRECTLSACNDQGDCVSVITETQDPVPISPSPTP